MIKANYTIKACENRSYWLDKNYVPQELKAKFEKTDILLVPQDGFRSFDGPLYPVGTEEFLRTLQDLGGAKWTVDVTVSDSDYKELALHSDGLLLAGIVASMFAAPIVVNMISEYLKRKIWPEDPKRSVKVTLQLQDGDGEGSRSVEITYDGSPDNFASTMATTLGELRGHGYNIPTFENTTEQLETTPDISTTTNEMGDI